MTVSAESMKRAEEIVHGWSQLDEVRASAVASLASAFDAAIAEHVEKAVADERRQLATKIRDLAPLDASRLLTACHPGRFSGPCGATWIPLCEHLRSIANEIAPPAATPETIRQASTPLEQEEHEQKCRIMGDERCDPPHQPRAEFGILQPDSQHGVIVREGLGASLVSGTDPDIPPPRDCIHGQLARSCDLSEKDREIASLASGSLAALAACGNRIAELQGVIDRASKPWLALTPGVAWEGDLADAMAAACAEITRLRAALAPGEPVKCETCGDTGRIEEGHRIGGGECTPSSCCRELPCPDCQPRQCVACGGDGYIETPVHHMRCDGSCREGNCPVPSQEPCPSCQPTEDRKR